MIAYFLMYFIISHNELIFAGPHRSPEFKNIFVLRGFSFVSIIRITQKTLHSWDWLPRPQKWCKFKHQIWVRGRPTVTNSQDKFFFNHSLYSLIVVQFYRKILQYNVDTKCCTTDSPLRVCLCGGGRGSCSVTTSVPCKLSAFIFVPFLIDKTQIDKAYDR